ncbi:MAG: DUF4124 domain-containing protein [Gammaproteobacteria bacterium]
MDVKRNKLNRFALSPPASSPLVTLLVLFLVVVTPAAKADIYKYIDKYGRVHLTDKPEHTGYTCFGSKLFGLRHGGITGVPPASAPTREIAPDFHR